MYGVRSGTKSILTFRALGNTSSLRKLFFEPLSVVFVASIPFLRVVASLVSSYCFFGGTAAFSSWRLYGLMSSLRHLYVFVPSGLPFVDCATYLGRYLMYGDIHSVPTLLAPCYSVTLLPLLLRYLVTLLLYPLVTLSLCYPVTLLPFSLVLLLLCCQFFNFSIFLHDKSQVFSRIDAFFGGE